MNSDSYASQVIRGRYIPHIDGIRTLAVLAVVLYHLQSTLCPGGFAGVDVFFVISGYLIGGGIIRDLQREQFSLMDFYTRRIKRIMPAYFFMILITLATGVVLFHYEPLSAVGNATLRSSYFFANFYCYKYLGDYFAGAAEDHPMLNLWSLSVEEQFYMIVPLAVMLMWKLGRKTTIVLIAVVCLASFINAETLLNSETDRNHIKAFYMLAPRAWELFAGVLLAMAPLAKERKMNGWLAGLGLVLILFSYACVNNAYSFPGKGAIASIIGAVLLIRYGHAGIVGKVLSCTPFVGIGKISYSLYLWHWPVIVYMNYIFIDGMSLPWMVFAVVLSFAMAYISWRFVEMPVRRNKAIGFKKAVAGLVMTCVTVAGLGAVVHKTNGFVHILHQDANRLVSLEYPPKLTPVDPATDSITQLAAHDEKGNLQQNLIRHLGAKGAPIEYVLIGDSHAEALQIGFNDICREKGKAGVAVAFKTCPLTGINITNTFANIADPFISWLEQNPQIRTVYLMCNWNTRISGPSNQILYRVGTPIPENTAGNSELLREGLLATCQRITALGRELVLIGPVPVLKYDPGKEARHLIMLGRDLSELRDSITQAEYEKTNATAYRLLEECAQMDHVRLVRFDQCLLQNGVFSGLMNKKLMYHDSNHLSGDGSRYVISCIYDDLFLPSPPSPEQDQKQAQ